jgi:hypothetical protein
VPDALRDSDRQSEAGERKCPKGLGRFPAIFPDFPSQKSQKLTDFRCQLKETTYMSYSICTYIRLSRLPYIGVYVDHPYTILRAPEPHPGLEPQKLTTPDPERLLSTFRARFGGFKTRPMRSATQIHDALPLRETVSEALSHFQRFSQISEVKNPKS